MGQVPGVAAAAAGVGAAATAEAVVGTGSDSDMGTGHGWAEVMVSGTGPVPVRLVDSSVAGESSAAARAPADRFGLAWGARRGGSVQSADRARIWVGAAYVGANSADPGSAGAAAATRRSRRQFTSRRFVFGGSGRGLVSVQPAEVAAEQRVPDKCNGVDQSMGDHQRPQSAGSAPGITENQTHDQIAHTGAEPLIEVIEPA